MRKRHLSEGMERHASKTTELPVRISRKNCSESVIRLEELESCIPSSFDTEQTVDELALADMLNRFLSKTNPQARIWFVRRYWYLDPVKEIAAAFGVSESKVKMTLLRLRKKLKQFLEEEGVRI